MSNWRKFWNLFSVDCSSCLWLLREDGSAVSGVQLRTIHLNSSTYCRPYTGSRTFWTSLGHPAGPSAPVAEGFGCPVGLTVTCGSSVWMSGYTGASWTAQAAGMWVLHPTPALSQCCGSLDYYLSCRFWYADIYLQVFVSFPLCRWGREIHFKRLFRHT